MTAEPNYERSLFSAVFGIPDPDEAAWFDPVLTSDNAVFVDPFLMDFAGEPEFDGAAEDLFEHFRHAFRLLAASPLANTSGLLSFPEMPEPCLGYTALGTEGAGSGRHFADQIKRAMLVSIKAGLDSPKHFEEIGLLSRGLGPDRISDITLRVVAHRFVAYTERVARELGLPVKKQVRLWGYQRVDGTPRPVPVFGDLPINPHSKRAVILVPKAVLRNLPTINRYEFEDYLWDFHSEDIRGQFNVAVKKDLAASILTVANANPDWVREYVAWEEGRGPRPYVFSEDPLGVGSSRRVMYEMGLATGAGGFIPPSTAAEVLAFVRFLVRHFKSEVENNRGYFLLYRDDACTKPRTEKAVQRLFGAMARGACEIRNVLLSRETDAGMGPVDFLFSTGYASTVVTELKLASNTRFWNGPGAQLPAYVRAQDTDTGMFVAVGFTDDEVGGERFGGLKAYVARVASESGLTLDGETVDARPKPDSASKLRATTEHP
jgi:hypothetical protein